MSRTLGREGDQQSHAARLDRSRMTILDLIKATVMCGGVAFLIYSFPALGQALLIGFLSLLWLAYAHKTIAQLRKR